VISPEDVPVRQAATVVLLRDGSAGGIEVWLLTRVTRMAFASGMTVFPGGRVDDADAALPWSGRDAAKFAAEFGCNVEQARALVGAAVRETFEETGVLITTPPAELSHAQPQIEAGTLAFGDLLAANGLAIDADGLRAWARWITPVGEPRRYDTHFFVARLPEGATAADLTTESSVAAWVPVAQAIAQRQAGERKMLPPTIAVLASVSGYSTVAEVLAASAGRSLDPVQPTIRPADGGVYADLPDGTSLKIR
jgi:8-oxo-dGTP pyrophosphatase MutT (NUDIX family)